jgi:predicted NBD/HSP70 family sugar kinase
MSPCSESDRFSDSRVPCAISTDSPSRLVPVFENTPAHVRCLKQCPRCLEALESAGQSGLEVNRTRRKVEGHMADSQGKQVFLSHTSSDSPIAQELAAVLESAGIRCWIAPRDIAPGSRYAEAIASGIEECAIFVLLSSDDAMRSPHVLNEIEAAASLDRAMLVLRMDSTDPASSKSVGLFLRSHQWLDAPRESLVADWLPIADAVRAILARRGIALSQPDPGLGQQTSSSGAVPVPRRASIGIEVAETQLRGTIIDLDNPDPYSSPTFTHKVPTAAQNARGLLAEIRTFARVLIDEELGENPVGIGLAIPGQVDMRAGAMKFGPNLFGARNVPFRSFLAGAFPRAPIRVDNEVRCATRAELHLGVGTQFDSFACVFVDVGVGSGIVLNRQIHFGNNFCAGEVGHIKIASAGQPCACGQVGCLETFIKAESVVARARAIAIDWRSRDRETILEVDVDRAGFIEAIEANDAAALEVADEAGQNLGLGLANYMNLVNPAAIVVGGTFMSNYFLHVIDRVTTHVTKNALAEVSNTPILQSAFADEGIAIGAALMFHDNDAWPFS